LRPMAYGTIGGKLWITWCRLIQWPISLEINPIMITYLESLAWRKLGLRRA
jgi:hypothetical protein